MPLRAQGARGQAGGREEYLDLDWEPGCMRIDFGQADFRVRGVRRRLHHLVGSFPYPNVGLPQAFPGENAECACAGLISIFEYVGGVPRLLVLDNATGVGERVCDQVRTSALFAALAAHYGFDHRFCNPASGNEKGNVENKVGALRRSLFVPMPQLDSVESHDRRLLDRGLERSRKEHYRKGESELALFEEDCFALSPLPEAPFGPVSYTRVVADKYGNVTLEGHHRYSSGPSLAGRKLIVGARAFDATIYNESGNEVARHERGYGDRPTESVDPVSQLALLCRKPGGWRQSRVRAALPDALRSWMDAAQPPDRAHTPGTLRDVTEQSGWSSAMEALSRMAEAGSTMGAATAAVLAAGIANGRGEVTYDEPVDMSPYDGAFALVGVAADDHED